MASKTDYQSENKIGEGRYREVFQINQGTCIKKLKLVYPKKLGFFHVNFQISSYTEKQFGITDFNEHEFEKYCRICSSIPYEISDSFAKIFNLEKSNGESIIYQEIIRDYNGKISEQLGLFGKVKSGVFWRRVSEIKNYFILNDIPFFNMNSSNVLVKMINPQESIPVLFDYKRIGPETYPFQPLLVIPFFANRKVKRCFERLENKFR